MNKQTNKQAWHTTANMTTNKTIRMIKHPHMTLTIRMATKSDVIVRNVNVPMTNGANPIRKKEKQNVSENATQFVKSNVKNQSKRLSNGVTRKNMKENGNLSIKLNQLQKIAINAKRQAKTAPAIKIIKRFTKDLNLNLCQHK